MARSKKKTGGIKFELGLGGMTAVAVSTLCVLLWVFVLGFWVGQKMVGKRLPANEISLATSPPVAGLPPVEGNASKEVSTSPRTDTGNKEAARTRPEQQARTDTGAPPGGIIEEKITNDKTDGSAQPQALTIPAASRPEPSKPARSPAFQPKKANITYFVLQIASYRKRERANKEAARWARKGYFTQVKQADLGPKKGVWYRVYLGKFDSRRKAIAFAVRLADKEDLKSYIVPLKK